MAGSCCEVVPVLLVWIAAASKTGLRPVDHVWSVDLVEHSMTDPVRDLVMVCSLKSRCARKRDDHEPI